MRRFFLLILLLLCGALAHAETVRVGVKPIPPFVISDGQGGWSGISVDLWLRIADDQDWQTEWVALTSAGEQVQTLAAGTIDVAVGALSITSERESIIDFSVPFYSSDLAIATPAKSGSWIAAARQLASPAFLRAVGILVFLLFGVGALLWLIERKRNSAQFGGSAAQGIGSGFWWSAVTMTTVGYGDKAPITFAGRLLATIWMFASIITISGFTAAIASSITVHQLGSLVNSVNDLARVRCVTVAGSTGEEFLRRRGIQPILVSTPEDGLAMLTNESADALLYDEPVLRYLLKDTTESIEVLSQSIEPQYYAFGLIPDFKERENLNRSLLLNTDNDEWRQSLERYLGKR